MNECQALVLAPTRELAHQIQKVVLSLGDYMEVQCHACIGGTNVRDDLRKLEQGVHVVVGTPGRVFDMINRRALRTDKIRIFVLDEADEMLSRGFKDQIYDVFKNLPPQVQVNLLSATMPDEVMEVTNQFMRDPIMILAFLSRLICSLVVLTSSRFRSLSTTICPTNAKTTFTELVAVVVSVVKVLLLISSLKRTGVCSEILRHITIQPLTPCQ